MHFCTQDGEKSKLEIENLRKQWIFQTKRDHPGLSNSRLRAKAGENDKFFSKETE